jgi:hypothetical protein
MEHAEMCEYRAWAKGFDECRRLVLKYMDDDPSAIEVWAFVDKLEPS